MPTLEVGRGAGTLHCSPTWLPTGVKTSPDTLQRAKAERSRAKELRQPLGHNRDQLRITLDHSTALLGMHATTRNDGDTPAPSDAWRRLADHHRTHAEHTDKAASRLEAQSQHGEQFANRRPSRASIPPSKATRSPAPPYPRDHPPEGRPVGQT
jgi:hypothetical protein